MKMDTLEQNPLFPVFTPEFGFNGESDWGKASLRVLFLFPSPASVKLDGRTPFALYGIIKSKFGRDVFVDICMMPPQFQLKVYYRDFPSIVGAFSRRTYEDFDVVAISVSVTSTEFAQAFELLWRAGFPLDACERQADAVSPLLVLGGVAAGTSNSFDGIADLVILGLGERSLVSLCEECLRVGCVPRFKPRIIEALRNKPGFCFPLAFPYGWHVADGHVESYPVWSGDYCRVEPDVSLDIESLGSAADSQMFWPVCGKPKRASVLTSWGCAGAGSCSFCAEGLQYGAWRERSLKSLTEALQTAKRTSMGESVSFQSFNSSFHSQFPELLFNAYQYFDHLSVLNFRLDALATSVRQDGFNNYLRVMKEMGSVVVAGGVEGFGERVRNYLYNKNLSFEDILCVAQEVFRLKFMKFKTGYILSGHETGADLKAGLGEIRAIGDMKRQLYGNCQYVVSVGKLVHYYGTPVYQLPRAASLMNWMETFGGKAAHYPFMDLPRELVSVKSVSGVGGTFIQQLHQDLPAQLSRKILLESALGNPVMGRGYLNEVKRRMEEDGIKPREQFMGFRPEYNPKQHYLLSPLQSAWDSGASLFESRLPCLKTVSSEEKGVRLSCSACRSCSRIDLENPRLPGFFEREDGEGHRSWLHNRSLGSSVELSRVKAVKAVNKPSFFYSFVFDVARGGRLVSKDALARLWFKAWAEEDSSLLVRFRKFVYSFSAHMDYSDMVSNYCGHEVVVAGFSEPVSLADIESVAERVNARLPTIKLVKAQQAGDTPFAPGYWVKARMEFGEGVSASDVERASGCFLGGQKFRIYSGSTCRHREVSLPFYFGGTGGSGLVVVLPAKVNPSYSLLKLWSYNKFNRLLALQVIEGVYLPAVDGVFWDVVRDCEVDFRSAGYLFVDRAEDAVEGAESALEIQGA